MPKEFYGKQLGLALVQLQYQQQLYFKLFS